MATNKKNRTGSNLTQRSRLRRQEEDEDAVAPGQAVRDPGETNSQRRADFPSLTPVTRARKCMELEDAKVKESIMLREMPDLVAESRVASRGNGTDKGLDELYASKDSLYGTSLPQLVQETTLDRITLIEDEKPPSFRAAKSGKGHAPGLVPQTNLSRGTTTKKEAQSSIPASIARALSRRSRRSSKRNQSSGGMSSPNRLSSNLNAAGEIDHDDGLSMYETRSQIRSVNHDRQATRRRNTAAEPGAVAVPGFLGGNDEDSMLADDHTTSATSSRQLPQAQTVNEESPEELLDDLAQAELVPESELGKPEGVWNWIKNHRFLSVAVLLVLIGAIVGGVVGGTSGGSSGGDTLSTETPAPTMMPTSAPTITDFELVLPTLSQITAYEDLTRPATPQSKAVTWLLREDDFDVDFSNDVVLLQRYALATIYFATNGANWTRQLNFLSAQDVCDWNEIFDEDILGVSCNDQGMVGALQLSGNGLAGELPSEIQALTALDFLSIAIGGLTGTIPATIGDAVSLTSLNLSTNTLSGPIPSTFGNLVNLQKLRLSTNLLSGPLDQSFGNLVNLAELHLQQNLLSGSVPDTLSAMTSLKVIRLEENSFNGTLDNAFCTGSIAFNTFYADCRELGPPLFLAEAAEVNCSCCSFCCHDEQSCLPRDFQP